MVQSSKILLAEDDDNDVFLMRAALERAEIVADLVVARDGQEAVEYLNGGNGNGKNSSKLCLMLLDLKMPRMDGFDVLTWIHNHPELSNLPVVVLSSSSQEADMSKARALGARDYQVKPADFHDLVRLVKDLHDRWLVQVA